MLRFTLPQLLLCEHIASKLKCQTLFLCWLEKENLNINLGLNSDLSTQDVKLFTIHLIRNKVYILNQLLTAEKFKVSVI